LNPAPIVEFARPTPAYLVAIDGGGTGTRARLQDAAGRTLGEGQAGPSGLSQGVEQGWRHVLQAAHAAWHAAGFRGPLPLRDTALGCGLAGAGVQAQAAAFLAGNPGFAHCALHSDAVTQLWGAFGGRPGIVVAAGTGSVAMAAWADGSTHQCGGWGFPVGDEGGGARLGLHAMRHAHQVLDGRAAASPLSAAVMARCGTDAAALLGWCAGAGQQAWAQLAPLLFDAAEAGDTVAAALLDAAASELARLAHALQPDGAAPLPVVVSGSIGERLAPRWTAALRARCAAPVGDSADGAMQLLRAALAGQS
jgi:glucosamine kinase